MPRVSNRRTSCPELTSMQQVTPEHGNGSCLAIVDYAIGMPKNQALSFFIAQRTRNASKSVQRRECNLFLGNGYGCDHAVRPAHIFLSFTRIPHLPSFPSLTAGAARLLCS